MRGFLFRAKRSSILQGIVLVCFSVMTALLGAAAVIARIMMHFGMQYEPMAGPESFSRWLYEQNLEYDSAYDFFMFLRPTLIEITESWKYYVWIPVLIITVLVLMFFYLAVSAGYHGKESAPCLRGPEKIPFDIVLPCFVILLLFLQSTLVNYVYWYYYQILYCITGGVCMAAAEIFCLLVLVRITAAKVKTETLFSGMLIVKLFRILVVFIKKIPFVWKGASIWGGSLFMLYLAGLWMMDWYYYADTFLVLLWTLVIMISFFAGLWIILQMDLVRKKAHQLAKGDLEQKDSVPVSGKQKKRWEIPVLPSFRNCMEDLDRISDGMNVIVEEKMKSERFQTELITNVSHDIKTPLTSIINYLDFLDQEEKKENRNPKVVQEYMEVLERQSVRLKKLIEDLIDASKASTGSLNIQMEPCELGIFLQQLSGEYEERLEKASLKLNLTLPDKKLYVNADGRYLWRVLDNLLQNVCKYAMAGTRVYLQLQEKSGQAIIVIKNVSACELNIPAEELMERFVRGDRSRHTEGSGLGLSIARSLTELQGGKFAIDIDGDLFKTAVGLPVIEPLSEMETDRPEHTSETEISLLQSEV